MKILKIILFFLLIILSVGCSDTKDCDCERIKSPYISNFLGEYSITENYLWTQEKGYDDEGNLVIDTLRDTTYCYTLMIEETKNKCYDIQLKALYASINYYDTPLQATISDDSTFFFYQEFPAYDSYGVIRGTGIINHNNTTLNMNYTKGGPNQYGEHNWNVTGIKQ